jgi:hypothetical protein
LGIGDWGIGKVKGKVDYSCHLSPLFPKLDQPGDITAGKLLHLYIKELVIEFMSNSPATENQPSYVKLAMRNMVRKGGTSLKHFLLTTVGLLVVFVGLAYLTH